MKLKSLLLGSAAALMTVSGANAADAVFAAEPEPMEYVKVCDTYGNGFFYIPGTETCIKFSGFVRSEYIHTDAPKTTSTKTKIVVEGSSPPVPTGGPVELINTSNGKSSYSVTTIKPAKETSDWVYRARFNIDARNETDWGTLRSQIRFQADGRGGDDGAVGLDRALISLGGLRLGYSDSYQTTHHGYGWLLFANDGPYGYDQAVFLDYTFAANGFSATVGVQDSTSTAAVETGSNTFKNTSEKFLLSKDPYDPYFGAKYAGSWGNVASSAVYNSSVEELAWKLSVSITAIENLRIAAWYFSDDGPTRYDHSKHDDGHDDDTRYVGSNKGDYTWGVSAAYTVNSQLSIGVAYSDTDDTDADRFGIVAHWNPVTGLSIRPEAVFGDDYTQVRLRIIRSF